MCPTVVAELFEQPVSRSMSASRRRASDCGIRRKPDTRYDAGKKIKGKTRYAAVDTLGLLINIAVSPADVHDRDIQEPMRLTLHRDFRDAQRQDSSRLKI